MRYTKVLVLMCVFTFESNIAVSQIQNGISSVLWKVRHPHSTHTSYLLGTFHNFGIEWVNSFVALDTLLLSSSSFIGENILERDTSGLNNFKNDLKNEKRTARDFFGKDFDLVNNYLLKETGVSIVVMDTSKLPKVPVLYSFAMFLVNALAEKHHLKVSRDMQTMDHILFLKADTAKKECIGLDSRTNLRDLFSSEKFIKQLTTNIVQLVTIINSDDDPTGVKLLDMLALYEKGFYNYDFNFKATQFNSSGLRKRNKDWIKQLPSLIKNKDCFIAVGIKHLNYKNGLLYGLAKQGFILTPVTLKQTY